MSLKTELYKCVHCGLEFQNGWSDEEAEEELRQNFGDLPKQDCDLVCDDCYKTIMEDMRKHGFVRDAKPN